MDAFLATAVGVAWHEDRHNIMGAFRGRRGRARNAPKARMSPELGLEPLAQ